MIVKFEGDEADLHQIEAYTGSESLSGIARAAVLVAHYSVTKEVRYRAPYSPMLQFVIEGTNEGSLEFALTQVSRLTGAASRKVQNRAQALLERVLARATGQAEIGDLNVEGEIIGRGDIDALAEAATPGLTRAHSWIDSDEKSISVDGVGGEPIVLDSDTKEYMNTEDMGGRTIQIVSVGALNANSRVGRIYFHDLHRTVPFKVSRDAHPRTISTLSRNLTQYIDRTNENVTIEYSPIFYPDKRLKRVLIFDCYEND